MTRNLAKLVLAAVFLLGVLTVAGASVIGADASPLHGHSTTSRPDGAAVGATVTTTKKVVGSAQFQVGDDFTQHAHLSSDSGGNPSAVASAKHLLTSMGTFEDVALMGWGSGDPEPRAGTYAWGSLDARVDVMGSTVPEDQRMITLCSAPGWMKKGGASQEWNMGAAVAPSHFRDFARLAAAVAERYDGTHRGPGGHLLPRVDDFDVWNEMKGFWNGPANTWDYVGYTEMYNDVYKAIKAVRPDARIGGPYAPVGAGTAAGASDPSSVGGDFGVVDRRALDVLRYWLQHKAGAQFISVAGGPAATSESGFASGRYFVAVAHWIRGLDDKAYPGARTLPLLWAEFYPGLASTTRTATGQEAVAIDMSNIIEAGAAGVNYLLLWEMEGTAGGASATTGEGVWTDTAKVGGGRPTALYTALLDLHRYFPPDTPLYQTTVTGPITALAGSRGLLLVSHSAVPLTVNVNQALVRMGPYTVTVVASS